MPRKFTDPGASNYFDYGRKTESVTQYPVDKQMSAEEFSLKDTMAKVHKQMSKKYNTAKERMKAASVFTEGFASGFAEKVACLKQEEQQDLLSKLYAIGTLSKVAGKDDPPPVVVRQAPIKQSPVLGKQQNMLGKMYKPMDSDPKGKMVGSLDAAKLEPDQTPLSSKLPSFTPKLGILQRNPRDFNR
jgi:hypothetical protein